jgi:hypothetical protein
MTKKRIILTFLVCTALQLGLALLVATSCREFGAISGNCDALFLLWRILFFPLNLFPESLSCWPTVILNSMLWGMIISLAIAKITNRRATNEY